MRIENADLKSWRSVVNSSTSSTFFHTPEWYFICKKMKYFRSIETKIYSENDSSAVFPLSSKGWQLLNSKRFISSPLGTYGGLIFSEDRPSQKISEQIKRIKSLTVYTNPFEKKSINFFSSEIGFTQILKMDKKNLEVNVDKWSSNHKRALKKAELSGMTLSTTEEQEEWGEYFNIYKANVITRGAESSNSYNVKLFDQIKKLDTSLRSLVVVKDQDRIIAGGLFFHYNKKMHYWNGASLPESREKKASFILFHGAIKMAKKKNIDFFDFMSSNGNEGVIKFKRGFGAVELEVPIFRNYT